MADQDAVDADAEEFFAQSEQDMCCAYDENDENEFGNGTEGTMGDAQSMDLLNSLLTSGLFGTGTGSALPEITPETLALFTAMMTLQSPEAASGMLDPSFLALMQATMGAQPPQPPAETKEKLETGLPRRSWDATPAATPLDPLLSHAIAPTDTFTTSTPWTSASFVPPTMPSRVDTGLIPSGAGLSTGLPAQSASTPSSIADIWAQSSPAVKPASTISSLHSVTTASTASAEPAVASKPAKQSAWAKSKAPAAEMLFKPKPAAAAPKSDTNSALTSSTSATTAPSTLADDAADDLQSLDPISQRRQEISKEIKRLKKKLRLIEDLEARVPAVDRNEDQTQKIAGKPAVLTHLQELEEQLRLL